LHNAFAKLQCDSSQEIECWRRKFEEESDTHKVLHAEKELLSISLRQCNERQNMQYEEISILNEMIFSLTASKARIEEQFSRIKKLLVFESTAKCNSEILGEVLFQFSYPFPRTNTQNNSKIWFPR